MNAPQISDNIFNLQKSDYETPTLIMGQKPGLFDTINKKYPDIWNLWKQMRSLDWDPNEFDYSSCVGEFETCPKDVRDMMMFNISAQWEIDTVFSRAIAPVLAPFITSSELWAAWQRISDNEVIHSVTYSEIVRTSFKDPRVILDQTLKIQEVHSRIEVVAKVFEDLYETSHKYALGQLPNDQETYNKVFLGIVALLCAERIQFMASFAVTFAICDTGLFQPIGKAIQKIAQDEYEVHVQLDKSVLMHELRTERGRTAFGQCQPIIEKMVQEVTQSELDWVKFLFSDGRELVGLNEEVLNRWVLYCAKDVYNFLGIKSEEWKFPKDNPLKFMEKWLDISKTQPAPQEQDIAQYKMNVMRRNDENEEFEIDF